MVFERRGCAGFFTRFHSFTTAWSSYGFISIGKESSANARWAVWSSVSATLLWAARARRRLLRSLPAHCRRGDGALLSLAPVTKTDRANEICVAGFPHNPTPPGLPPESKH